MISSHWDSRVSALRNLRRYCLASSKLMEKVQKGLFFVLLALFNSSLSRRKSRDVKERFAPANRSFSART